MALIADVMRALVQLLDPRFLKVALKAAVVTLILLIGLGGVAVFGVSLIPDFTLDLPFFGATQVETQWLPAIAGVLFLPLAVFLIYPVTAFTITWFLEDIVAAVEYRFYPGLPAPRGRGAVASLGDAIRFGGLVLGINLAMLVVYVFSGPLAPVLFIALNGYLLGREYFELVAARRLGRHDAKALRKRFGGRIFAAGCLVAVPLAIPLINILLPVVAAAVFTHQYHRFQRAGAGRDGTGE